MPAEQLPTATVASRIITEDGEEAVLTVADLRFLARCCRTVKRQFEADQARRREAEKKREQAGGQ